MAKLPQPPLVPFLAPASTEEAVAHAVHLTEGVDATKPRGTAPFVGGLFANEDGLLVAARAARAAGYTNLQAWSPFPVHGLDPVLGLQRSLIGRPVFVTALAGFLVTFAGIAWLMTYDWTVIYGGKPYYTWQLWVVPMLEAGLLFAAVLNLKLVMHTCKMIPDPFTRMPDPRVTDDQFCLAVSTSSDGGGDATAIERLLRDAGAESIIAVDAQVAAGGPIFRPLEEEVRDAAKHRQSQEHAHA